MSGKRLTPIERKHIKATRKFLGKQSHIITENGRQDADEGTLAALFKAEREIHRLGK